MGVKERKKRAPEATQPEAVGTLAERIEAAQAAQDALAEQRALEAQAAELDDLLDEREYQQRVDHAEAELDAAREWTAGQLDALKGGAADFRQRFEKLAQEAAALVEGLGKIQRGISEAQQQLHAAATSAHYAREPWERPQSPADLEAGDVLPMALADPAGTAQEWERAGGRDPALAAFPQAPPGSLAHDLMRLIRRRARVAVYDPGRGRF